MGVKSKKKSGAKLLTCMYQCNAELCYSKEENIWDSVVERPIPDGRTGHNAIVHSKSL